MNDNDTRERSALRELRDAAGLGAFCLTVYAVVYAVGTVMAP